MKDNYVVIDNFLDKEYFDSLVTIFTNAKETEHGFMPWFFQPNVANENDEENKIFYMNYTLYVGNVPMSNFFNKLIPLLDKLEIKCLLRVKANLYPNTHKLHEHPMHADYPFFHSAAILSLNTCDGYTKLKDGTKIDSVANRVLLFDASEEHCSTTTTNVSARINININYIQEQIKEQKKSAKTQTLDHSGRSDSPNNE